MRPARSARGPVPEHTPAEIALAGVALADAEGLTSVTMRGVAAAIGTAPASLYRYVDSRSELVELMADHVAGEYSAGRVPSGAPLAGLLALARQALGIYRRHEWLLDVPPGRLPGPNALAYLELILVVLAGTELSGADKLELAGLFTGAVRSFAQLEAEQRRASRDPAQWQEWVARYLLQVVTAGAHPQLAAALADQPAGPAAGQEPLFDRAMTRILTGLLPAARHASPR